jgi:TetR/AcrR family transcriptional regulator, transcriptional repressor for nem operon
MTWLIQTVNEEIAMGHSQDDKAASHERILRVAARRFRERGFDGVGLAKLMSDAGMTLGGFYKHFDSRDRLVAEATSRAFSEGAAQLRHGVASTSCAPLGALFDLYLTPAHRDDAGNGCPVAALAADAARTPAARKAFSAGFRAFADWVGGMLDGPENEKRARGAAVICAMAGAVAVARALDDPMLSDETLQAARRLIENAQKGKPQLARSRRKRRRSAVRP